MVFTISPIGKLGKEILGAFFRVTADRRITEPNSELSGVHKIM